MSKIIFKPGEVVYINWKNVFPPGHTKDIGIVLKKIRRSPGGSIYQVLDSKSMVMLIFRDSVLEKITR